jgi:hypothetical protein
MQLVANARALLAWLFTLIEASQNNVECEAPEEEARRCAAGEEEGRYEEKQRDADGEEGVDEGGRDGEKEAGREGDEEGSDGEGDEEEEGDADEGSLDSEECLLWSV